MILKTCNPSIPGLRKNTYIEEEPLSYPCIFVYTLDNEEDANGTFIYPNDF